MGDTNDHWVVEIVNGQPGDKIKTVTTLVKLRHKNVGCYLHSHSTQLPKWWGSKINFISSIMKDKLVYFDHMVITTRLNISLN